MLIFGHLYSQSLTFTPLPVCTLIRKYNTKYEEHENGTNKFRTRTHEMVKNRGSLGRKVAKMLNRWKKENTNMVLTSKMEHLRSMSHFSSLWV